MTDSTKGEVMPKPTDPQPEINLVPGEPNPDFTRIRPMTWNMSKISEEKEEKEELKKDQIPLSVMSDCVRIGKDKTTGKEVFVDNKTRLFFIFDSRSPKNKGYISRKRIDFTAES